MPCSVSLSFEPFLIKTFSFSVFLVVVVGGCTQLVNLYEKFKNNLHIMVHMAIEEVDGNGMDLAV